MEEAPRDLREELLERTWFYIEQARQSIAETQSILDDLRGERPRPHLTLVGDDERGG
jgi:hypothetical protein